MGPLANTCLDANTCFEINDIPRDVNSKADALTKYTWQTMTLHIHFIECVAWLNLFE